jgi:cytochrome P450
VQIDAPSTQAAPADAGLVHAQEPGQAGGRIRKIANAAVDRLLAHGNGGLHQLVSSPYPLHVVMQILGVPEEDEGGCWC